VNKRFSGIGKTIVLLNVGVVLIICLILKSLFAPNLASIKPIPSNKIEEIKSPDGKSSIVIYLSGAVLWKKDDFSYIGQLHQNGKTKNMLWLPKDFNMTWVDQHTVNVNGQLVNIDKGTYDFRWNK